MKTADDTHAVERTIPTPALTLGAKCWGDPQLPPVLALHGWLDNAGSFDRLAAFLAANYHVVALDLRGHGHSGHVRRGGWYHYVDYFDDINAVFDHFNWRNAILLGHSLGGTLTSLYSALYPERVAALWSIEALGPLTTTGSEALARLRSALDQRVTQATRRPLRVFNRVDDAIAVRMRINDLSETAARAIVERGIQRVEGGYAWSSDPRLTLSSPQRFTESEVLGMLGGIRCRTLAIFANPATPYLPPSIMAARAATVAGIHVQHLDGNHHLHLERAADVAAAIQAFANTDQTAGG